MTRHDRLYWVFGGGEKGPAFGPVTDEALAVDRARAIGDGAFVLGVSVMYAAYPNWEDDENDG